MAHLPWMSEHRIGPERAGALARSAFGLHCEDVHPLGEGWDFVNYLCDGAWVLRLPKRARCDAALVHERQTLERLGRLSLPAAVPRFEYFSAPLEDYPWHFAAYRYLPGTPLSDIDDEAVVNAVAPEVGAFLAALHQAPDATELASPWPDEEDTAWAIREFRQSIAAYPPDLAQRIEAYLRTSRSIEPDVPRVLAHADLLEEHMLIDPVTGALTAVIDWADACTTLRTADFGGLFYAGGRGPTARGYASYGVEPDADEWRWLERSALLIAIGQIFYGWHDDHPEKVAGGLERIRRYLP